MKFFIPSLTATPIAEFIDLWISQYDISYDESYDKNIDGPLTDEKIDALFKWKATGRYFKSHRKAVERYKSDFSSPPNNPDDKVALTAYIKNFNTAVWPIFWLHIHNPALFPIFDQHVYRAMRFLQTGEIKELGTTSTKQLRQYFDYIVFFNKLKEARDIPNKPKQPRNLDRALVTFGAWIGKHKWIL